MQRQRGELVPIGDALSGMGGPVKAIRDASPQAVHHFTRFDQVNLLGSFESTDSASDLQPSKGALLHDSTAARVGALFQLLVQDTTAQDFGLPSSAIRLRM